MDRENGKNTQIHGTKPSESLESTFLIFAMLRILHLDTGNDMRGGQWQLLTLARGLRDKGHCQLIVCPPGSRLEESARREAFETCGLSFRGARKAPSVFKLRGLIRGFDIIHAHDGHGQTFSWFASSALPVKRIASRRVVFLPRGRFIHRLKYGRGCHGVIAVSAFVRTLLLQSGIAAGKIQVIPDGIDFPASLPDPVARAQARRSFQLDEGDFAIGHAGAFTPEKGQEIAIQAFQLLAGQIPNARLLLAGEGGMRRPLAGKYGLGNPQSHIRLTGYLNDLSPFMNSIDLFLMPSLAEGLGSAALIAMAHGVPVIASRTGGLPEIVEDGETGWLTEPGSPSGLAEKIVAAASRPEILRRMEAQAREKARGFTNDIMVEKTERFYQQLIRDAESREPPAGVLARS
ncbi:MAG: glycosyltransferase family 4 protein [Terriglobia bacterium]